MLNRVGRVAAAVTVSAAIAASCGTAEPQESAPPTTTQSPVLSTPSTPPVTDPPATTTPPPTTSPAPETTSPAEGVEQEVINAYLAAWNAFDIAAKEPSNEEAREAVLATHTGASLEGATRILDGFVSAGYRAKANPLGPSEAVVEAVAEITEEAAYLRVCEVDSDVVVETGTAPDGSDAIVNDEIRALRLLVRLERTPDGWRLRSGETVGEWTGTFECAAQ